MIKSFFIVFAIYLLTTSCISAQNKESLIKEIDLRCNQIRENLNVYDTITSKIWDESTEGGQITGYYENKEIKLIEIIWYGESGKNQLDYYFDKGKLIFALDQKFSYNRPIYWDEKAAIENDDDEFYDPDKTIVTAESYYFKNEKLTLWLDNNQRKVDLNLGTNSITGQGLRAHCYKMKTDYKL